MQTARTAMQALVPFPTLAMVGLVPLLALAGCGTQQLDPARVGRELATDRSNRNLNILANREDKGTCASIGSAFTNHFKKMEKLHGQAEAERREPPSTIALAYGRLFGPEGAGYAATEELRQERAKIDRLDAVLTAKGCSSIRTETPGIH
jgi:hypothetical protein